MLVYIYETGRIVAMSKRAEQLIGEKCSNINTIWEGKGKQKFSKEVLTNGSIVLYQRYITNKKDRLVIDLEVSSLDLSEEHVMIVLFEESYKRPFCKIYRKRIPRITWRNKKMELLGCNTFLEKDVERRFIEEKFVLSEGEEYKMSDIRSRQEKLLKTQEGQFDLLEEVKVEDNATSFARVNRISLSNKNGTSVGILTMYTLILDDEVFQAFQDEIQRENNILSEAIKRSNWIAVTWEKGAEGIVDYISPNVVKWGYTLQEFYEGKLTWKDIIVKEDYPLFKYKNTVSEGVKESALVIEYRIRKKDDEIIWVKDETIECTMGDSTKYKQGILAEIEKTKEEKEKQNEYSKENLWKDKVRRNSNKLPVEKS